jgi:hypothetical protein
MFLSGVCNMRRVLVISIAFGVAASSQAQVTNFTDFTAWTTATDYSQEITFASLGFNVVVTNQYAAVGVSFLDAVTFGSAHFGDGIGIFNQGGTAPIEVDFANPTTAFGTDLIVGAQYALFDGTTLVGTSNQFGSNTFAETFGGVVSTQAFNRVVISNWAIAATPSVDNIHWGAASVPEPMSMFALCAGIGALVARRRKA